MSDFSKETLIKALEYYRLFGLTKNKIVKDGEVLDLYQILGAKPDFDENGKRLPTPYEMIMVPPQFVDGEEVPIVFAIKNKAKKIGKYTGDIKNFVYKSGKVKDKEESSLLETLKENYKKAVLFGNEAEAEKFLSLIDQVTAGGAEAFLDSFYDYTRFYRRMKKQLIIDMFAHFFMMYMKTRSIMIKRGIIKTGRVYRAYKDRNSDEYESDYAQDMGQVFPDIPAIDMPNLKSVVFEQDEDELEQPQMAPGAKPIKVSNKPQPAPVVPPPAPEVPVSVIEEEIARAGLKNQVDRLKGEETFEISDIVLDENGHIFIEGINDLEIKPEAEKTTDEKTGVAPEQSKEEPVIQK